MGDSVKIKEAAIIFGVSMRRISQLIEDGTLKKAEPGRVSCETLAAMLAKERSEAATPDADYERDKARKMNADADKAEIEAAQLGGKLVEKSKTERKWANVFTGLRQRCMAMPARLGPMVVLAKTPGEAVDIIDRELRSAFDAIVESGHKEIEVEAEDIADESGD